MAFALDAQKGADPKFFSFVFKFRVGDFHVNRVGNFLFQTVYRFAANDFRDAELDFLVGVKALWVKVGLRGGDGVKRAQNVIDALVVFGGDFNQPFGGDFRQRALNEGLAGQKVCFRQVAFVGRHDGFSGVGFYKFRDQRFLFAAFAGGIQQVENRVRSFQLVFGGLLQN